MGRNFVKGRSSSCVYIEKGEEEGGKAAKKVALKVWISFV